MNDESTGVNVESMHTGVKWNAGVYERYSGIRIRELGNGVKRTWEWGLEYLSESHLGMKETPNLLH